VVAQYLNRHVGASSQACAERCVLTNVINVNTFGVTNNDTLTYSRRPQSVVVPRGRQARFRF